MNEFLRELLAATQNPDQQTRHNAEIAIHDFFKNREDAIPSFLTFVADANEVISLRHLAVLLLNQQIARDWATFRADIKHMITTFAFQWVSLFMTETFARPMSAFHRSATILLAKVYDAGSTAEVAQIATAFAAELQSDQLRVLLFSLRSLCEIAREAEYFKHVELLRACYPRVQELVLAADSSDEMHNRILLYSMKFMRICTRKFGEARIACGFDDHSAGVIDEYIPLWSSTAVSWLSRHVHDASAIVSNLPIILECLKSLTTAIDCFCHNCRLDLNAINAMNINVLRAIRESYLLSAGADAGYSSDGDREDLEMLVVQIFELLCASLSAGGSIANATTNHATVLDNLVVLLAEYMSLSTEQVDTWFHDSNGFISAEYDDTLGCSLRQTGADVINQICRGNTGAAYYSLMALVQQKFAQLAPAALEADSSKQVLHLEGILWMLGGMRRRYLAAVRAEKNAVSSNANGKMSRNASIVSMVPSAQLSAVLTHVMATVMKMPRAGLVCILQSRALWICGEMMDVFEQELQYTSQLAVLCVSLMSQEFPLTLRFQACCTLGKILYKKKCDVALRGHSILHKAMGLCAELAIEADENTVHMPIETATYLLRAESGIPNEVIAIAVSCSMTMWFRFASDSTVVDTITKLVTKTLRISPEQSVPILHSMFLPHLHKVLFLLEVRPNSNFVEVMVRFLPELVRSLLPQQNTTLCVDILQLLVSLINHHAYASSHAECIQAINCVLSAGQQEIMRIGSTPSTTQEFVQAIVKIISRVFTSLTAETSALDSSGGADSVKCSDECIGPTVGLFCHVMLKAHSLLPRDTCLKMVTQANTCLQLHKSNYVRCAVGMGFIHIFARDVPSFAALLRESQVGVDLLASAAQRESNTGMPFLDLWYTIHGKLSSRYNGVVSTLGMLQLISMLSSGETTQQLAVHFLELLLVHLPKVLLCNDEIEGDDDFEMNVHRTVSSGSDDEYSSEGEEWEEDDDLSGGDDGDDGEGWEDDESFDGARAGSDSSPFAPAELYLSDILDQKSKVKDNDAYVDISDNLVFSPAVWTDPIIAAARDDSHRVDYTKITKQLQEKIVSLLLLLRSHSAEEGFPTWMQALSKKSMHLANALLNA